MAEDDELIAERYRLLARVGSGAMGVVWRAEDERLRRTVALKQVRLPGGVDERSTEQAHHRVMREGRLVARIHHPHAIAVFDVVDHDAEPWLVMEYLPSRSLAEVVADDGALTPHTAAAMGHQVAAALTAAHAAGIVHRDVKPGNVLLGTDGVVKVTDFGISRAVDEATITSAGMMAGTPAYLAPEVARGAAADFRSDVYSLGSTIYAAVEGEPPFGSGENPLALLHRVAGGDHRPPQRAGSLAPLLERMLAADPVHRPEMHQVRDELERLAAVDVETDAWPGEPGTTPTVPVAPPAVARGAGPEPADAGPGRVAVAAAPPGPGTTHPLPQRPAPGPAPEEQDDTAPRRRRPLVVGLALLLVAVVAVVALVLVTGGGGGTGATTGPSTAGPAATGDDGGSGGSDGSGGSGGSASDAPAAPAPGTSEQVAQQQAVIDYYGLIPGDLPEGWQRLTPSYQATTAGGFAGYSGFWGGIRRVDVRAVSPGPDDTVDATVTYDRDGGGTSEERTLFRLVEQDGAWKIDGSQVLSSR